MCVQAHFAQSIGYFETTQDDCVLPLLMWFARKFEGFVSLVIIRCKCKGINEPTEDKDVKTLEDNLMCQKTLLLDRLDQ